MDIGLRDLGLQPATALTFGTGVPVSFYAPLTTTLVPTFAAGSNTPTFARATTAMVEDHEGILRQVPSGAARFKGARMVWNTIAYSQDLSNAVWIKRNGASAAISADVPAPDGTLTASLLTNLRGNGTDVYQSTYPGLWAATPVTSASVSMWIKRVSTTGTLRITNPSEGSKGSYLIEMSALPDEWVKIDRDSPYVTISSEFSFTSLQTAGLQFYFSTLPDGGGSGSVLVWGCQQEITPETYGPSGNEYVSTNVLSAPFHGAGVDGVKYFNTDRNGNPLDIDGYLAEGARQNRCLYSQDFSNAAWAKTNITLGTDVAAPDGSTTGDCLIAGAANSTIIQNLGTVASAAKTFSVYLKRKTGTGDIQMTLDGGSTWTTKTITSEWARYSITQTLADEDCGIRIVTSGDEVYAWGAQVETASFASSYIPTTTAAVTRNADDLSFTVTGNIADAEGSLYAELSLPPEGGNYTVNGRIIGATAGSATPMSLYGAQGFSMFDGTYALSINALTKPLVVDTLYKVASSWSASANELLMRSTDYEPAPNTSAYDGSFFGAGRVQIGSNVGGNTNPLFGRIKNVRVWGRAFPTATLAALTA